MKIAFLTLFLGLISGPQMVELSVTGPVARVELLLDGAPVRVLEPPWKARVDFGAALTPHELVARALDDKGGELGRIRQWINLPRPPAEVELVPEAGPTGKVQAVRLSWQSLTQEQPAEVNVTFDGRPLALDGERRVQVPDYSGEELHVLSAEVRFSAGVVARKDLAFGGGWGAEVATELTAVPVKARPGEALPPPQALQGRFRAGGQSLRVAAVEQGPADLLMVRDPGAPEILEGVGVIGGRARRPRSLRGEGVPTLRHEMALGQEDRIRFIWPAAQAYAGSGQGAGPGSELFASSQEFTARDGGLFWLLTRVVHPHGEGTGARLADAVAVAGIQALAGNHRRAVLLVLTGETADASRYDPAAVRRYLESIRVPLLVWSLRQPPYPPAVETWGGDVWDVSTLPKLQKAVEHLQAELAAQRIVWVEGLHLPQSIAVAPEAGERQPALR